MGALFAAAVVEPEVQPVVAEGRRRHRNGARLTVERIAQLGGLRDGLSTDHAIALLAAAIAHETWHELVQAHNLSWDEAEQALSEALTRAILTPA